MKIKKGNLVDAFLKDEIDILAHGTNCSDGFGSGIAKEIAEKLPEVKVQFHKNYKLYKNPILQLGTVDAIPINNHGWVFNCYTQEKYGNKATKGYVYLKYEALHSCMKHLCNFASNNNLTIGIPKIGCGLAGGDWKEVKKIIEIYEKLYKADITIYEL